MLRQKIKAKSISSKTGEQLSLLYTQLILVILLLPEKWKTHTITPTLFLSVNNIQFTMLLCLLKPEPFSILWTEKADKNIPNTNYRYETADILNVQLHEVRNNTVYSRIFRNRVFVIEDIILMFSARTGFPIFFEKRTQIFRTNKMMKTLFWDLKHVYFEWGLNIMRLWELWDLFSQNERYAGKELREIL